VPNEDWRARQAAEVVCPEADAQPTLATPTGAARTWFMNARNKLNVAYLNGCLFIAAFIGLLFQSWPVLVGALVVLVIGNLISGGIRRKGRKG
jgi:hypothetical protein